MNVKEYISSGIIESYVLGLASEEERQDFEAKCAQYPEIEQARNAFERSLEMSLLSDAPQPPVLLKQRVTEKLTELTAGTAALPQSGTAPVRRINIWKWVAAAAIVFMAGAGFWAVTVNHRYQQLEQANNQLKQQLDYSTAQLTELKQHARLMEKPTVKMASLQPMPAAPGASAKVFWDSTSKDVYLYINNLPQPPTDKQYQLWALLNDKPVDLGVFELHQQKLLVKMKNVSNAQAFAITLEPKGGSPEPTGQMYVMGRL